MSTASELFSDSDGFDKPALNLKAFGNELCSQTDVLSALRSLSEQEPYGTGVRVFENGGLIAEGQKRIMENPPVEGESISEWANRLFGDKKFGLVVNSAERYNDKLTAKIAEWFEDIFEISGFPVGGLEMVFFIGNYGFTPFGVHLDRDQATVFHFNLGPGNKTGFVWKQDEFVSLTGSTDFHFEPENIIDQAVAHEFGPGDIYAMPSQSYHIARCDELTVDIAVALVRMSTHQLADKLVSAFRDDFLKTETDLAIPPIVDWDSDLPDSFTQIESRLASRSLSNGQYGQEYLRRLRSNGGFNAPPGPLALDSSLIPKSQIQVTKPYQMHTLDGRERTFLFARGYKLDLVSSPALSDLISRLNSGLPMEFEAAVNDLSGDYEPSAAEALLRRLIEVRALTWDPA